MAAPRRLLAVVVMAFLLLPATASADDGDDPVLTIFWGDGCPHCAAEWEFLADLAEEYPDLVIRGYEVWHDPTNQALFESSMLGLGLEARAVPTTIFDGRVWEGFSASTGSQIRSVVASAMAPVADAPGGEPAPAEVVDLPLFGEVDVGHMPLLASTALIALVDGINPCSLWVLSILLALVLRTGSRRRVMAVGATFLAVTALLYGLYIAGMYGLLNYATGQTWVRLGMAALALGFGVINLKDYFWQGRGPSLSIPAGRKPAIYRRIRSVAAEGETLPVALAGTALLAIGVSVLETPCTAGYPLLWANLLNAQGIGLPEAIPLFVVYMTVFLLDELIVFGFAVVAMRAMKLEEGAGRLLKLISGMVMVALALTLVLAPDVMSTVGGALAVFGLALVAILGVLAIEWIVSRRRPPPPTRGGRGIGRKTRARATSPSPTGPTGHKGGRSPNLPP